MKRLITYIGILLVSFGLLGACTKKKSPKKSAHQNPVEQTGDPRPTKAEEFASSYGVMNFRQLSSTYQSLTGVTLANEGVLSEYEAQLASLPKSYDPAAMSSAKVSAATKLAASYCDAMSLDQALISERMGIDMQALGSQDPNQLATTILTNFYGPETALQGDRSQDVVILAQLITELRAVQINNNPVPASSVFLGACTAALSSAEFYLY